MSKKLWGGRFEKEIDKDFFEFQKSIDYDYRLAEFDIHHSLIHISALRDAGILSEKEEKTLNLALTEILNEVKNANIKFDNSSEDIHTAIQNKLEEKVGAVALKLHTLRSRNDQIVFDEKFYCLHKALDLRVKLLDVRESILDLIKKHKKQYFIGYTHTKRAQTISFASYLLAFAYMFRRDSQRIKAFYDNLIIYIGAGALTGSSLTSANYNKAIQKSSLLKNWKDKLKLVENGLDNVSDRDFIIEFLSIISITQMHLSRLAEDLILYSTKEFNFINLPEEFCTGSSLMPHKKNPDFLELVRGYTGRIYGNLLAVLTMMKGLPLTYNRDMQLDKEPLFSSVEIVENELKILTKFIKNIKLNEKSINKAIDDKTLYVTEVAEWLAKNKKIKVAFKNAHYIAGKLTLLIEKHEGTIKDIKDKELKQIHPALSKRVISKVMNAKYAVQAKKTISKEIPKK